MLCLYLCRPWKSSFCIHRYAASANLPQCPLSRHARGLPLQQEDGRGRMQPLRTCGLRGKECLAGVQRQETNTPSEAYSCLQWGTASLRQLGPQFGCRTQLLSLSQNRSCYSNEHLSAVALGPGTSSLSSKLSKA